MTQNGLVGKIRDYISQEGRERRNYRRAIEGLSKRYRGNIERMQECQNDLREQAYQQKKELNEAYEFRTLLTESIEGLDSGIEELAVEMQDPEQASLAVQEIAEKKRKREVYAYDYGILGSVIAERENNLSQRLSETSIYEDLIRKTRSAIVVELAKRQLGEKCKSKKPYSRSWSYSELERAEKEAQEYRERLYKKAEELGKRNLDGIMAL